MTIKLVPAVVGGESQSLPIQPAGSRFRVQTEHKGDTVTLCGLDHWAFDSCGIISLFSFGRDWEACTWWEDKENTKEFIKFLDEISFKDGWRPQEFVFALAGYQWKKDQNSYSGPYMHHLVADKRVRRMDRFTNKAHGPAHIYMFRLSFQKDFKYLDGKGDEE